MRNPGRRLFSPTVAQEIVAVLTRPLPGVTTVGIAWKNRHQRRQSRQLGGGIRPPPTHRFAGYSGVMNDPIIQQIEAFRCRRASLTAERRNRGYTLYNARSGAAVTRLRTTDIEGRFHVLYWSLWKERWIASGPLGPAKLSIDRALEFIAAEDIFWAHR